MKLSDKQRKYIWIGVAVLALIHFAPPYLTMITRQIQSSVHAEVHSKPSPAIPMATAPVVLPPVAPSAIANAQSIPLAGKYGGDGMAKTRLCKMELELHPPDLQGQYTGYTSLACWPAAAMVGQGPHTAEGVVTKFRPAGAILTGSAVNGTIKLKANKTIETLADGCPISGLSIVSFGVGRVAVDWDETGCEGGQLVLTQR
jgi:hypothetical protein